MILILILVITFSRINRDNIFIKVDEIVVYEIYDGISDSLFSISILVY